MNAIEKAAKSLEKGGLDPEVKKKLDQDRIDLYRAFAKVFKTDAGKIVLEELERISKYQSPNYDNINRQYAKIGQQELVKHIHDCINKKEK